MVKSRKGNCKGFGHIEKEEQEQARASWAGVPVLVVLVVLVVVVVTSGLSRARIEAPAFSD